MTVNACLGFKLDSPLKKGPLVGLLIKAFNRTRKFRAAAIASDSGAALESKFSTIFSKASTTFSISVRSCFCAKADFTASFITILDPGCIGSLK